MSKPIPCPDIRPRDPENLQTPIPSPYTYLTVKTPSGDTITGYTSGKSSSVEINGTPHIDFTGVYITDISENPERLQLLDGNSIPRKKKIIKGTNISEWKDERPDLLDKVYLCPRTGTPQIYIPIDHIVQYHYPQSTLREILMNNSNPSIKAAVSYISDHIDINDLGLYGSNLVGIVSQNPKDIDLLVVGLEHLPVVKTLAENKPDPQLTNKFADLEMNLAKQARDRIGKIVIPGSEGLYCDIKVVARNGDGPLSYILSNNDIQLQEGYQSIKGKVINDSETLSAPGGVLVETQDGQVLHILNTSYEYIGAGQEGMTIEVQGQPFQTSDGRTGIVIADTRLETEESSRNYIIEQV
ncbi:hypothetical protein GF389_02905 [Candidatus Dojkabacteria bacterium]|nr:hypothetical protein [Candidatus Dojkabacteria bacterium]